MKPATHETRPNRHAVELAEHRRRLDVERLADCAAAVVTNAATGSFASLRPRATPAGDARAMRLLAESATRRMQRWHDPLTGGLDPDDRDGLLRQADVLGLPAADAARLLDGVEAAWRQRPPVVAAADVVAAHQQRRRWGRWLVAGCLALVTLALLVVQWLMMDVWRELLL